MLPQTELNTFRTALPLLARFLSMGTSWLGTGAPGPALIRTIVTSAPRSSPSTIKPISTTSETALLINSVESNKTSSDIIGGSIVLSKIFKPQTTASSDRPIAAGGFELMVEPSTEKPFHSTLPQLTNYTPAAALARLENSPWQGKFTQVKIGADGTCFYGKPRSSNFFEKIYPLMVTTHGVCIEPLAGKTITLLGSWDELRGNTSIKTIAGELGPRHTKYIRNISGETNPFAFSKKDSELDNASDGEHFDHLEMAMERNEPICIVTSIDP